MRCVGTKIAATNFHTIEPYNQLTHHYSDDTWAPCRPQKTAKLPASSIQQFVNAYRKKKQH